MSEDLITFPPGLILILGAILLAVTRGQLFKIISIVAPALTLASIQFTTTEPQVLEFLDWELVLVQFNRPTQVFATIFSLMALGGAFFALNQNRRVELPGAFLYSGSAVCVTFAGDIFTLFVFWELMAIGSTIVVWSAFTDESKKSGMRYVNVHLVGGVIFMAGIVLQVLETGSIAIPHYDELTNAASVLMLIGILINAGTPPFGSWLPDAYPAASESGTVFLSAFTTKTSVYVLIMMYAGLDLLIYAGSLMAVWGIVYAILENDMRRILAYSIINQVGFMVCAVGIGTEMAINGAAAHAFAHIIYKALLLMSAGSVLYMTKRRLCTDLGGLYKTMPITMWCGTIGALAISSVPFTSGFTAKSLITDAAASEHLALAWFVLMAASAGVFLHAGIKFPWFVFFQKDRNIEASDPPWNMKWAMIVFSGLCIFLGVYPEPLYAILPYPAPEGEVLYEAYTTGHVVQQFELLIASGAAFFLLLPMLKRTRTITLDFDVIYRKLIPMLWNFVLLPLLRSLEIVHIAVVQGLPRSAREFFGEPPEPVTGRVEPWGVGPTVLLFTVVLLIFVVINLWM